MSETILDLVGDGDEPRSRHHRIGGPSAWTPPPPPPPLNFAHLRVVASGDTTPESGPGPLASDGPAGGPHHDAPASPPPPPGEDALRIRQLEQELSEARNQAEALQDEAEALHQMLEDLPEIFERKFRQRLQAVLEHQQHLIADNQALRDRLFALGPAAPVERPQLPPANEERWGLGRRLRQVLRQDRRA